MSRLETVPPLDQVNITIVDGDENGGRQLSTLQVTRQEWDTLEEWEERRNQTPPLYTLDEALEELRNDLSMYLK